MYLQEAYRRWVCSTLVPYFAEPQDVDAAPTQSASASTSGDDLSVGRMATLKPTMAAAGKSKRAASGADGSSSGSKHKSQKLISNNNKSNNGNNMNEPQINQQPGQEAEEEQELEQEVDKPKQSANTANVAQAFYNAVGIQSHSHSQSQFQFQHNNNNNNERRADAVQQQQQEEEEEVEAQFNNFISTANKADPSAKDPVISKLQKR